MKRPGNIAFPRVSRLKMVTQIARQSTLISSRRRVAEKVPFDIEIVTPAKAGHPEKS